MNEAFRYWHAVYNASAIAVGTVTAVSLSTTAFVPIVTQIILAYSKFKLERPAEFTIKSD